jgi:uncharacterized protein YqgV (UPF0045/DUF77 family)
MSTSPLAQCRHRRQRELWARTAAVAGRLNRAQGELVDIAAEPVEERHWAMAGSRPPDVVWRRAGGSTVNRMRVRVEFTTEPFHGEGDLPSHVTAAAAPLVDAGLDPELGPLGTSVEGEADALIAALSQGIRAALDEGATRVTVQVERADRA